MVELLVIPDFLRRAEMLAIERARLCKKKPVCPSCETPQVQIIDCQQQLWKCRKCKQKFNTEFKL